MKIVLSATFALCVLSPDLSWGFGRVPDADEESHGALSCEVSYTVEALESDSGNKVIPLGSPFVAPLQVSTGLQENIFKSGALNISSEGDAVYQFSAWYSRGGLSMELSGPACEQEVFSCDERITTSVDMNEVGEGEIALSVDSSGTYVISGEGDSKTVQKVLKTTLTCSVTQ